MTLTQINSAGIADGAIVNADINNSAAVALSKLATSGTASSSNYLRGDGAWSAIDLSTKLNLTGGTLTGNVIHNDNVKALFGTGSDLEIFHDATDSILYNNTGVLALRGNDVQLTSKSTEKYFRGVLDGSVELYYDGTKKLSTDSNGVKINSSSLYIDSDNEFVAIGAGDDLKLKHNGSNSYITNTTGALLLRSDTITFESAAGDETYIDCNDDGAVELFYNNNLAFKTDTNGVQVWGTEGNDAYLYLFPDEADDLPDQWRLRAWQASQTLTIESRNGSGTYETNIECNGDGNVELYYDNVAKFYTLSNGVQVVGHVVLEDSYKLLLGTGEDLQIYHDGSNSYIEEAGTGDLMIESNSSIRLRDSTGSVDFAKFTNGTGVELYYDNSKKLETISSGIKVTGTGYVSGGWRPLTDNAVSLGSGSYRWYDLNISNDINISDNGKVLLGDGDDLQIYHDGSNSIINETGTGSLFVKSSIFYVNSPSGEDMISATADGAVELYYDNSKKFETTSTGIWCSGYLSGEGLDIADNKKLLLGSHDDLEIYHDGGNSIIADVGTGILALRGSRVQLESASGSEALIDAREDSHVSLYYDGSQKFYTQSDKVVSAGHHYPESNYTYNLGHENYQWHTVFAKNTAKAYGNFNQTNHGARRNWNIQSYTDYGTGQTRVTFTTALAVDYIVCASGSRDLPESSRCYPTNIDNINTGYFELTNHNDGSTNVDWALMMFTVFGSS